MQEYVSDSEKDLLTCTDAGKNSGPDKSIVSSSVSSIFTFDNIRWLVSRIQDL